MELVDFLRARLDEDAARATAAAEDAGGRWYYDGGYVLSQPEDHFVATGSMDFLEAERGEHIARHDPARVLREIDAKREVVRLAKRAHDYHETFMNGFAAAMEGALRQFARPHRDHPDFDPAWLES